MRHWLFFLLFFLAYHLRAQELFFNTPAAFQNLPSVETYQVLQDSKGAIWITTDGGLCRYDGNTLKTFTVRDGIAENVVLKGYEDKKGRIWFTTISGYFFYYYNNRFYSIAANDELKNICLSWPITSFFIGENDTLYCSTMRISALLKIPPQQNYKNIIRKVYDHSDRFCYLNKLNPSEAVFGVGSLQRKKYTNFVFCYGEFIPVKYDKSNYSYAQTNRMNLDNQGNLYYGYGMQLMVIRKSTKAVEYYKLPYLIICVYQDKDSNLWIGTQGGGYLYQHSNLKSKPLRFLPGLTISSILLDRERSAWVTTTEKGIFKSNNQGIILLNEKGAFFQKNQDQLIITCKEKKIARVFKNDSIYRDNSFSKSLPYLSEFYTSFIDKDYSYFNINLGALLYYRFKKDTSSLTLIGKIDSRAYWKLNGDTICTVSPKIVYLLYHNKLIDQFLAPFAMQSSLQLKDKRIIVASRNNNGIYEFKKNAFIPFLPELPELKTRVNCMVEDSSGNLWFATNEHGLYCYEHNKKLHAYNMMVSDKLNSLTLDNKSNLWATTNGELIRIDYSKDIQHPLINTFNQSNGVPNFQLGSLTEFNGKIWCCTKENLFYFDSDKLIPNQVPPLIYIKSVFINDSSLLSPTDTCILTYNENNIRIQSTLISNKNITQKQFMYILLGYDNNWHSSSTGDVQYTNLSPGTYTFMMYGLNNDKVKSDKPAMITFIVNKPFWFTWWFILLEISIIFMIIYFSIQYWKHKIEKREREKASINQEISEFKMTALRSQMNPHFIFNAIGSIQHYILKNEIKQSYNYLSKFSMLIRNILNNSRQEYISLTQEINTLRLYIELEQIRFTVPFEFAIEIDEELDMEMDIPTMLIQPYVENSIWHGLMSKESGAKLELIFKKVNDSLLVVIRDNGIGRKEGGSSKHVSRGMSITEHRINMLTMTNKKKFITTIIDLKDETGGSKGTEVNLIIPFDV